MTSRAKSIGYRIIFLWMFWPFIPVMAAGIVGTTCGCKIDEGSVHPCIVLGKDIGHLLYGVSMMGFFGMATVPTGIIALVLFSVIVWLGNRPVA